MVMSDRELNDLIEEYWDYLLSSYSQTTANAYRVHARAFLVKNGNDVDRISKPVVIDYIDCGVRNERGKVGARLVRKGSMKVFCDWLMKEKHIIKRNFADGVRSPKPEHKLPVCISQDDKEKLLAMYGSEGTPIDIRNRVLVEMLFSTGCRISELINMRWCDIDIRNRTIKVQGKGSKERIVFLNKSAYQWLLRYRDDGAFRALTGNTLPSNVFVSKSGRKLCQTNIFRNLCRDAKAAGIETHIHPHMFRHTLATELLRAGADLMQIKEILGHTTIATTQIYISVNDKDKRKAFEKLYPSDESNGEGGEN